MPSYFHTARAFLQALRLNRFGVIYVSVIIASLIIAARFPITNDESYYIAYAKDLQLSYVDAPPFVAYLSFLQVQWGLLAPLYVRLFVIILHFFSTLFLQALVYKHAANANTANTLARQLLITFLLAYIVPIFGLFGFFILPDCGLIFALSLMLWVADRVVYTHHLSWKNTLLLGLGLGIGLLSKYHMVPLGGGLLLGVLVDLSRQSSYRWSNLGKLIISGLIGMVCAWPLWVWNIHHHFASFIFQFKHGFSSNEWHLRTMLAFIVFSAIYLTPWFAFILIRRGLLIKKHAYLLIPFFSLLIILLMSSLRKSVLPHWISPAFWLLIPYAVMNSDKRQLQSLMKGCRYTAVIWIVLMGVLLLPGGLMNIKQWSKIVNPDPRVFTELLLFQELPTLIAQDAKLTNIIDVALHQKQPPNCLQKKTVVGTLRWYWTSQLEYYHLFSGAKILNLDQHSSSFYLWRDKWSNYAHCNVLVIGIDDSEGVTALAKAMTIHHRYLVHGLGDYRSLQLRVLDATLKDSATLQHLQHELITNTYF